MITDSDFKPAWWLRGRHAQTLFPYLFRRTRLPPLRRERLELPDGDFIDLDWSPPGQRGLVLLLHGLEGNIRSHYAGGILATLHDAGYSVAFMHFRGCSGEPNRLARSYHSGETGDLDFVVQLLLTRFPRTPLSIAGVSLGGNVLLKWLGEQGVRAPVNRAVAISVPFEPGTAASCLQHGFARIYQRFLLSRLRRSVLLKSRSVRMPVTRGQLKKLDSLRHFDQAITAPVHGFESAEDYYRQSSCRAYLAKIARPTLIVHAKDDPFMDTSVIPTAGETSPSIRLELSEHGGHAGFISGQWPVKPIYWLDVRVLQFLSGDSP